MKPAIIAVASSMLLTSLPAAARLDETPAQCQQRYGDPVREIAGANGVAMARVYNKEGMEIIAVFVGPSTNNARVGLILYNSHTDLKTFRTSNLDLGVENRLLATVPGRWETYTASPKLTGSVSVRKIAPVTSMLDKHREESLATVKAAQSFLYPHPAGYVYSAPSDLNHMTNTRFAFRISSGLAIVAYDAVPVIQRWLEQSEPQKPLATPTPKDLSNF